MFQRRKVTSEFATLFITFVITISSIGIYVSQRHIPGALAVKSGMQISSRPNSAGSLAQTPLMGWSSWSLTATKGPSENNLKHKGKKCETGRHGDLSSIDFLREGRRQGHKNLL